MPLTILPRRVMVQAEEVVASHEQGSLLLRKGRKTLPDSISHADRVIPEVDRVRPPPEEELHVASRRRPVIFGEGVQRLNTQTESGSASSVS